MANPNKSGQLEKNSTQQTTSEPTTQAARIPSRAEVRAIIQKDGIIAGGREAYHFDVKPSKK